jgi:glycosyltransferase involved in cell wall biosynthesis
MATQNNPLARPIRVLLFVTSYHSTNGYSYVGYELAKTLSKRKDIHLTIYGFQRFHGLPGHRTDYPSNVYEYDAFANENPKQQGFGFGQVKDFVTVNKPDVCVVYNDMLVLQGIITQLLQVPDRQFKIISYIDQVYLCQKKEHIEFINQTSDTAMMFTPYWEDNALKLGIRLPSCYLRHGFSKRAHYRIPKQMARKYYNLSMDDFIVMNLNRNQPRKRWDTCMQAMANVVSKRPRSNIKLLISTALVGAWNLIDIYERELKKYGIDLAKGLQHIIIIDNPQNQTDDDVNIMYNVADIGINTCDGEGFGLCNFQQAAIGIPQVVSHVGGFRDFFDETNAIVVKPKLSYYVDASRDGIGGEAEMCDYRDFADGIIRYYDDPSLCAAHGKAARKKITEEYGWDSIGDHLCNIVYETLWPSADNKVIRANPAHVSQTPYPNPAKQQIATSNVVEMINI